MKTTGKNWIIATKRNGDSNWCYRGWGWWQLVTLWTLQGRTELALLQRVKVVAVGDVMNTVGKNWTHPVTEGGGCGSWWRYEHSREELNSPCVTEGDGCGSWWRYDHCREELNWPCCRRPGGRQGLPNGGYCSTRQDPSGLKPEAAGKVWLHHRLSPLQGQRP